MPCPELFPSAGILLRNILFFILFFGCVCIKQGQKQGNPGVCWVGEKQDRARAWMGVNPSEKPSQDSGISGKPLGAPGKDKFWHPEPSLFPFFWNTKSCPKENTCICQKIPTPTWLSLQKSPFFFFLFSLISWLPWDNPWERIAAALSNPNVVPGIVSRCLSLDTDGIRL